MIPFALEKVRTSLTRPVERRPFVPQDPARRNARCEQILSIQTAGLQKRWQHTCSKAMVVGVSGGLDSALALLVAVRTADRMGTAAAGYSRGDNAVFWDHRPH